MTERVNPYDLEAVRRSVRQRLARKAPEPPATVPAKLVLVPRAHLMELRRYAEWHGGAHDVECPMDDTCDCSMMAANDAVNALCDAAEPAEPVSGPASPEPPAPLGTESCMGQLVEGGEVICKCAHGSDGICGFQAEAEPPAQVPAEFDFRAHLQRQREWSARTFGPGDRAKGVVDHIRKECDEIDRDPTDLSEWIDVVILGLDGAWRAGASPEAIIAALVGKQTKNEGRTWPDWRTQPADRAIEHERQNEKAEEPRR